MLLTPGHSYPMGASSSPDSVVILAVTDETVTVWHEGFDGPVSHHPRAGAEDLIRRGTAQYCSMYRPYCAENCARLDSLIAGESVAAAPDMASRDYVAILARFIGKGGIEGAWEAGEDYGISGVSDELEVRVSGQRGMAERIATDDRFHVIHTTIESAAPALG